MAATIAVLSQKGGTGKTTTVRTLTDVFRSLGLEVLAVDLDPQGNLSDYLDVDPEVEPTIGDVLTDRAKVTDAVHDGIIPANLHLAEAELTLGGKMGRELTLRKALAGLIDDYDIVLIDCPPALGLLTVNALVASTHALLSAEAQYFALQGVEQALELVGRLGRPVGLDAGVLLDRPPKVVVAEGEHPAVGVVDEDDLLRAEQALRDGQRADRVVGDDPARVADDVGVALLQAEYARQHEPGVHARDHGDLLGRW